MAATLLTVEELKLHVETDLTDAAVQRILDAEESRIIRAFGAHASQSDRMEPGRLTNVIYPTRRVDSITSITERLDNTDTVLSSDDYEVVNNGKRIDRLPTGTNARSTWGDSVVVIYSPADTNDERKMVLIDLCKVEIEYTGNKSEDMPDMKQSKAEIRKEKNAILGRLSGPPLR